MATPIELNGTEDKTMNGGSTGMSVADVAALSGGGFGGIAIALTNGDFSEAQAKEVAEKFHEKFGAYPKYFRTTTGAGAGVVE